MITARPAKPADATALEALFEATGSSCYCRYFHFEGDKNDWLARCALEPDQNRAEMVTALETGSDDGHGIAPENRARVFQPYFTTKETGTGLGLFVCRHIVEQTTGGRIELAETSASGTTFTVFLTCDNVRRHPDVARPLLASAEVSAP